VWQFYKQINKPTIVGVLFDSCQAPAGTLLLTLLIRTSGITRMRSQRLGGVGGVAAHANKSKQSTKNKQTKRVTSYPLTEGKKQEGGGAVDL